MNCSICDQNMTDPHGTTHIAYRIDMAILDDAINWKDIEWWKKYMAPYSLKGTGFNICWPCWLKSLGAPIPSCTCISNGDK